MSSTITHTTVREETTITISGEQLQIMIRDRDGNLRKTLFLPTHLLWDHIREALAELDPNTCTFVTARRHFQALAAQAANKDLPL